MPAVDDPSEKLFDKAGADTLLPRLRTLIRSLQEVAASGPAFEGRERLAHAGRSNGSPDAAASVFRAAAEIQAVLEKIAGTGAILRDLATGLCDFPAVREGRPVYLCWRLGEDEVGWWHPRDTGVAGREPL
ncbi:MAG TPA: hypothetical protein DCX12_00750 [Chloroflexi bacterium]|jgi:hypothetical protein|nr:hypothetical protein [Chloroflexota bacterium]HBV93676.1 hypothetical protein [Chloroflexota bacterium]